MFGAGCSVSTGIPSGKQVAQDCARLLVSRFSNGQAFEDPEEALAWLRKNVSDFPPEMGWGDLYGYIFETYLDEPVHQQKIIRDAIAKGGNRINWAHVALGGRPT